LAEKQPYQLEYRLLPRDGVELWVWEQGCGVFNDRGEVEALEGLVADITARKRAEAATRELSGRLLAAQDEERRRIARELHDTTAQTVAALCMNLTMLEARLPASDAEARRALADAVGLGERASQEIRTVSYLLHPPILEHVGLAGAIREFATGFSRRSGIQVAVEIGAGIARFTPEVELALLRIVQESLGNVHRHSGSLTAVIRLRSARKRILLEIEDAGRGFHSEALAGGEEGRLGVGIAGMRERLRLLGGQLDILSGAGGTTIRATLPLPGAGKSGMN
jgi:signal transduction histidine kinase